MTDTAQGHEEHQTEATAKGLTIERRFTTAGDDPYSNIEWMRRDSKIANPDGSVVFEMKDAEIPAAWSQVAADIMVSKYFRKAGVPQSDKDGTPITDFDDNPILGPERSAKDVFNRLAETWRHWGEQYNYFATAEDAQAFEDELKYMLANQMAAPNSPQWFNTGLFHSYGITGSPQGFWFVDEESGELTSSPDAYSRPAPHACFIQSVDDDLVSEGGIMDLWVREARLFKMGSGTGSNFSNLRAEGEPLAGGGKSSGLMSFLKIGDRAAGAIKSGGTTRRAAKMVILDMDHPDIEEFIAWKKIEEDKARILIEHGGFAADFNGEAYATVSGQNSNNSVRASKEFLHAVVDDLDWELTNRTDGKVRKTLKARDLWRQIADAAWACADPGMQYHSTIQEWHTSPAGGEIRATNPCFTGDALVHTDKGLVQFVELLDRVNAGEKFAVYTHDATNVDAPSSRVELTSPEAFLITGVNEIVRLRFKNGMEVRCTPNHRFWTANRGWVRADELSDDDQVQTLDAAAEAIAADWTIPISNDPDDYWTKGDHGHEMFFPEIWTDDFAHYLGWLIGDGSTSGSTTASIYGSADDRTEILPQHQELLTAINGGRAPKASEQANGTMQLRISRRAFKRYLEALGVKSVTGPNKTVPWAIEQAPTEAVAMFLRGLFDADGCAVLNKDKGSYVGLGSTSNELLRGVQRLLTTFGITSSIYKTNSRGGNFKYTRVDGTEVVYDRRSTSYDLRITGESLMRYAAEVGFALSHKQAVLTDIATSWDKGPYKKAATTTLVERTDDGQELTYNLTESRNHSYVVNGLVVSNCSEYVFLDDTACNLASINLVNFTNEETGSFNIEAYQHAIRIWTIVLEISVTMAHFPSKAIAQGSFDYRTLGLGYANLGSLLMRSGIAYDSDLGRAIAGALTSILTGESYAASAEMAEVRGAFPRFEENRESMLRVIRNHRRAAYDKADFEDISTYIMGINADLCPPDLLGAAQSAWDKALELGEVHGFRNAQATVLAPTGTIGLLMDCDTTGVEPDFALVKFKKLAGGGYFKIANQSIAPSLARLDYTPDQVDDILAYVIGTSSLEGAPHVNAESLAAKGFTAEDLATIEESLPATFDLRFAFNVFSLGTETLQRLGFGEDEYMGLDFDLLAALGFSKDEITTANNHICGRQTIEGAPHLLDEHLPVFDCANRNGKYGQRFIHHTGHIKMMAAAQPFISGAISKCVTGETLLTTADGLIRIGSLHQSERPDSFRDEVIEVASLDGPQKTDAFYYGGMRPVRDVTLRNGHRVTGTPNHRLLTAADGDLVWRRLDEIGEGEYVANQYSSDMWSAIPARFDDFTPSRRYGSQKSVRIPEEMTDELAFLLGAYVAEGNITRANWTIHITNADEGVLERTSAAWRSLFDVAAPIRRPEDRCWSVEVSSKEIVEFLDYLGCGDTSYDKRIPDAVLRSPRSTVLEFLSGLFLDGCTTIATAPKMAICVASSALMDDLQAVLTNLGVLHSRVEKYNKDYERTYHEVYAAGSEAQRLARLVPFAEEDKAARASELLALEFHPNRNTADVIPSLAPRDLYEMIPAGKSGRNGYGERSRFSFLGDPRTRHVTWRTLARVAMLPEVELPEWLHRIITDDLHFSPVTAVGDAGVREVFDVSVPGTHAFVGNGIVNHNTINMPNEVTVDEVAEAYMMSWELGIKAMALYRDGSKASQPLSASSDDAVSDELPEEVADALIQETMAAWGQIPAGTSPTAAYSNMPRPRFLLPPRRQGWTQEARIGGHKVFLRAGEYDDGTLGEIFIDLAKEGATLRGVLASFAIAISKGLQYGVPLEEFVDTFTFQTFEPRGMVEGHPNIKMANSIIDYIFRSLGLEYLNRDELVQVPPDRSGSDLAEPPKGLAAEAGQQLELTEAAKEADIDAQASAAAFADSAPASDGNGVARVAAEPAPVKEAVAVAAGSASLADATMGEMMGDAPVCSSCGHMTVRNGSCYVCLTCGDTTGCS